MSRMALVLMLDILSVSENGHVKFFFFFEERCRVTTAILFSTFLKLFFFFKIQKLRKRKVTIYDLLRIVLVILPRGSGTAKSRLGGLN
jgi:hypothetical protein